MTVVSPSPQGTPTTVDTDRREDSYSNTNERGETPLGLIDYT